MKRTPLLILLFLLSIQGFSQDYVSDEKIKVDIIRSNFSIGVSPFVFVPVTKYSQGPGVGLEVMALYGMNKNFTMGGFIKVRGGINEGNLDFPGNGYSGDGTLFENVVGGIGYIFEYKIFNKVGFNLRAGYEDSFTSNSIKQYGFSNGNYSTNVIYEDNDPGFVYGGGISLYIKRDDSKHAVHSFNWGITFESNNSTNVDILNPGTNKFEQTEIDAFYVQFGWRIQFHGLKSK